MIGYSFGFLCVSQLRADVSLHVKCLQVVGVHIQGSLTEEASHLKVKAVHVFFSLYKCS